MQAAAGSLVAGVSGSSGAQGAVDIEPRSKQNRRSPNVKGSQGTRPRARHSQFWNRLQLFQSRRTIRWMVEAMVSLRNLLQVDSDIHEKIDGVSSSFPRPFCIEQQFATDAQTQMLKIRCSIAIEVSL